MIDMIFVFLIFMYALLVCGFLIDSPAIVSLTGIGIMIVGIHLTITGITNINSFITESIGVISICLGFYVLLNTSLEFIEESGI